MIYFLDSCSIFGDSDKPLTDYAKKRISGFIKAQITLDVNRFLFYGDNEFTKYCFSEIVKNQDKTKHYELVKCESVKDFKLSEKFDSYVLVKENFSDEEIKYDLFSKMSDLSDYFMLYSESKDDYTNIFRKDIRLLHNFL